MTAPAKFYEGLGASLCGAIMGEDPHRTAYDVWNEFLHPEARPQLDDNEQVEAGVYMEPAIARWAATKWGIEIDYDPARDPVKHPRLSFMQCHPDALVVGEAAGLECKNRGFQALRLYRDLEEAEHEMDRAQASEVLQCHASMAVTGATHWYLAVAVAGQKLLRFRFERDDSICRVIEERYAALWECIQSKTPPPPMNIADCHALWPTQRVASFIDIEPESPVAKAVERRKALKDEIKARERELDLIEFQIKATMRDNEELRIGGAKALTWKAQPRSAFQLEEFRIAHPELAASFTDQKKVRVMR